MVREMRIRKINFNAFKKNLRKDKPEEFIINDWIDYRYKDYDMIYGVPENNNYY